MSKLTAPNIGFGAIKNSRMGVTIHFEGKLNSPDSFQSVINMAKLFAITNGLSFSTFQEDNKILSRVKDEEDWEYNGATMGILINPDENCDPLNIEFDCDYYIQEYCKTQFADISVHILVIDLLRQLEPQFEFLTVFDEGEYWETSDIALLQNHFDNCFKAIEEAKQDDKNLEGPFRLADGRIVDLMQNNGD